MGQNNEIVLQTNIVKPIGQWLIDNLSIPLTNADKSLKSGVFDNESFPKTWILQMQDAIALMIKTQNGLRNAEKVKIKLKTSDYGKQWDFVFENLKESKKLEPVDSMLIKPLVDNFISALTGIYISKGNVLKFAELIQLTGSSESARDQAGIILQTSKEIEQNIGQFIGAKEIKVTVDDKGKLTIELVKS